MSHSMDEIVVIPCAFFYTMADWDICMVGHLQDVSGYSCDQGRYCGCVIFSCPAEVFVEVDIKHPVQAVFDLPVPPRDGERFAWGEKV